MIHIDEDIAADSLVINLIQEPLIRESFHWDVVDPRFYKLMDQRRVIPEIRPTCLEIDFPFPQIF